MMGQLLYLPWWFFKNAILRRHHPLQTVLFITDHCNLRCAHCAESGHSGSVMKPYEVIREELEYSYRLGSRFVDFEGGEPTLWRDKERDLNDLFTLARKVGFYSCTLTTNGQAPFGHVQADSIWVSVDGFQQAHDAIRGPGTFARLDQHIRACGLDHVSVNMAINQLNYHSVAETVRYAAMHPNIDLISLNFHTPYPGTEHMMLPWEKRCELIDQILELKRQGYPIMNSASGLKTMKRRDFPKDCWVSNFILADGTRLPQCPGRTCGICNDCGFGMSGEMHALLRLRPDTVLAGLHLRV